ncbi:MAG: hypothetical protein WAW23_03005 [Candidatus Methanoperedens sp.]
MPDKPLVDVLSEGSVLISAKPSQDAEERLYISVFKSAGEGINAVIWICYQHTSNDVEQRLNSKNLGFKNIVFIDMISQMMGLVAEKHNTIYCSSPTDYGCMFRSLEELFNKHGRCMVVVDNLNAMMSYDALERLIKTIRNLNNTIPQKNSAVVYLEILGACSTQTQITLQTTMNRFLTIEGGHISAMPEKWEDVKKISWTDVFTLNAPVFFGLILTMTIIIILLTFLLVLVIIKKGA